MDEEESKPLRMFGNIKQETIDDSYETAHKIDLIRNIHLKKEIKIEPCSNYENEEINIHQLMEYPELKNVHGSSEGFQENMMEGSSTDYLRGGEDVLINTKVENWAGNNEEIPAGLYCMKEEKKEIISPENFSHMMQSNLNAALNMYDEFARNCSEYEEDMLKEYSGIIAGYVRTCNHLEQLRIVNLVSQGSDLGFIYFMRNFNSIDDTLCSVERTFGDWKIKGNPDSIESVEYLKGYGSNLLGNLGVEGQYILEPVLINIPPVKKVSMSNTHTVFLAKNNTLFGCGTTYYFLPTFKDIFQIESPMMFTLPKMPPNEKILDILASETFTAVLTFRYIYFIGNCPFLAREDRKEKISDNCFRVYHSTKNPKMLVASDKLVNVVRASRKVRSKIRPHVIDIPSDCQVIKTSAKFGNEQFLIEICNFESGLFWSPDAFQKKYAKICIIADGKVCGLLEPRNVFAILDGTIYIHLINDRVLKGVLHFVEGANYTGVSNESDDLFGKLVLVAYLEEMRGMSNASVFAVSPDGNNVIAQIPMKEAQCMPRPIDLITIHNETLPNQIFMQAVRFVLYGPQPTNNFTICTLIRDIEQIKRHVQKLDIKISASKDDPFNVNGQYHSLKILLLSLFPKDGCSIIFTNALDSSCSSTDSRSIAFHRLRIIEERYSRVELCYPKSIDERYREHLRLSQTESYGTYMKMLYSEWTQFIGRLPRCLVTAEVLRNGRVLLWALGQIKLLLTKFMYSARLFTDPVSVEVIRVLLALIQVSHRCVTNENFEFNPIKKYVFSVESKFAIEKIVKNRVNAGKLDPASIPLDMKIVFNVFGNHRDDPFSHVEIKTNSDLTRITKPKLFAYAVDGKIDILKISNYMKWNSHPSISLFHYFHYSDDYFIECQWNYFGRLQVIMKSLGIVLKVIGSTNSVIYYSTRTDFSNIKFVPDNTPREDIWVLETRDGGCLQCHRVLLSAYSERLHEMGSRMEKNENGEVVIKLDTDQPTLQHSLFALCDIKYLLDLPFQQTIHVFQFFHDNMMCEAACDALDVLVHNANEFNCHLLHPLFEKHAELLFERLKKRPSLLINHRTCPFPQPVLKYYKRFVEEYPRVSTIPLNDIIIEGEIPFKTSEIVRILTGNKTGMDDKIKKHVLLREKADRAYLLNHTVNSARGLKRKAE